MFDVDLFVIGGGSGGVRAARVAAEHGARVAIAEADRWGGTCVIRGCVPKKLLVYASEVSRTLEDAAGNGWTIGASKFDWAALIAAKDREITRLSQAYSGRLAKAGVQLLEGRARLADAHTIEIAERRVTAANILVATGSRPRIPHVGKWISSDEAFDLEALPERIVVLGGGYIGIEFAHIFAGFGAKVSLVHRLPHVLRGFDLELREEVQQGLAGHGIESICGEILDGTATSVTVGDHTKPAEARVIPTDLAMAAVGRDPVTEDLGLVEAGVVLGERGKIDVDEYSRSSVPHIFAVGDVTSRVTLTPIAIREGHGVADTLFGNRPTAIKHHLIPTAVFSQPPAAAVGLTEHAARAAGHDVHVFRARFRPMRYALSGRAEQVLIKVLVDRHSDRVLGLHMVGPDAPEIVQSAAIAITMGATKADLDRTFALHPTTAEELVLLR
jgi:glutathione reductase (NADPH)